MPHHPEHEHDEPRPLTPEQQAAKEAYEARVFQLAAEMKAGAGPLYDEICLHKNPDGSSIQRPAGEDGPAQG